MFTVKHPEREWVPVQNAVKAKVRLCVNPAFCGQSGINDYVLEMLLAQQKTNTSGRGVRAFLLCFILREMMTCSEWSWRYRMKCPTTPQVSTGSCKPKLWLNNWPPSQPQLVQIKVNIKIRVKIDPWTNSLFGLDKAIAYWQSCWNCHQPCR